MLYLLLREHFLISLTLSRAKHCKQSQLRNKTERVDEVGRSDVSAHSMVPVWCLYTVIWTLWRNIDFYDAVDGQRMRNIQWKDMKVSLKCLMKHLSADTSIDAAAGDDFYPGWVFFLSSTRQKARMESVQRVSQMKLSNTQFVHLSRTTPLNVSSSDASIAATNHSYINNPVWWCDNIVVKVLLVRRKR